MRILAKVVGRHWEMIIADWLVIVKVWAGTNGTISGKLYCTITVTKFPGLLQDADGVHVVPVG